MAVLLTGGAGYIGSHTSAELLGAGYNVVIADNFSNSTPETVRWIGQLAGRTPALCKVDLLERDGIDRVFTQYEIDSVIHFAGLKAVGQSVQAPLMYYHNNITGTLNLCEAMKKHNCKRIVFSSSATVYGTGTNVPFREDDPLSATNPYGWTKLMIEQILRDVWESDHEWSVALLRYFNPVGAHNSGLIGEVPRGVPNNLMPYIAQVATGKRPHLNVFGNDYHTPDGTGVRDYMHVLDLASGHIKALEYIKQNCGVEAVNLGTGRGTSVLEMVAAFEAVSGMRIPYVIQPRRPGDISICYADPTKAKVLLGWTAKRGLEEMCADLWNFAKNNL
ncbi:MAG: UDP-glucose 4-epimerase GalE [Oscillospiraceae bacterium]|nr:UDP-glucose 4-epimerase GalE [Oscillospiraceae bacterium]